MMKFIFLFLSLVFFTFMGTNAQIPVNWEMLAEVNYKTKTTKSGEYLYVKPKFSDELKSLDGKEVVLKGYILPITVDRKEYVLSQFPFTECFFCGGAGGQESVVELKLRNPKKYRLDEVLSFKGVLRLNEEPYELFYYLEGAEELD